MHRMKIRHLKELLHAAHDVVLVSNKRISEKITIIERDLDILSATIQSQPQIVDAYEAVMMRFNEVHQKLILIKKKLIMGSEVPYELLHLFNITNLVTEATLRHSTVHTRNKVERYHFKLHVSVQVADVQPEH